VSVRRTAAVREFLGAPARPRDTVVRLVLAVAVGVTVWVVSKQLRYPSYKDWFDLQVYQGAVTWWLDGNPLYSFDLYSTGYGFTYPPFAAVLMTPLAALSYLEAAGIYTTVNVALVVACTAWFVLPLARRRGWTPWFALALAAPVVLLMEPVRETIGYGQVNLLLGALIAADAVALRRGWRWAGVGTGLAIAVKLTPAVFVLYLLLTRQWRAAGVSTGTAVLTAALAFAISPGTSVQFWGTTLWETSRVGDLDQISNQSLMGVVARLDPAGEPDRVLWAVLVLAAVVIGMWRALRAHRAGDQLVAFTLVGLVSCLASPVSWTHHLYWLVPAVAVLVDVAAGTPVAGPALGGRPRVVARLAGAGALVVTASLCAGTLWAFGGPDRDEPHQTGVLGMLGEDTYVVFMVVLLVCLPVRAVALRPAPSTPAPGVLTVG
jgi:alpha-1,2-mannosyltransferase